jgi:hypothetical protein
MAETTPFSFVNAVNDGKDIEVTNEYSKYLMNRNFSMFQDTIHIANQANSMNSINDEMHFKFYRNLVSRRKRFCRWPKSHDSEIIKLVSDYLDFSMDKTLEALNILTDIQIEQIKEWGKERVS